jgi:hypothetical protein
VPAGLVGIAKADAGTRGRTFAPLLEAEVSFASAAAAAGIAASVVQ